MSETDPVTSTNEQALFSEVEQRLFRITAVFASGVLLIALIALSFWGFAQILATFYHLLLPLAAAGILALVLFPVVDFLQSKFNGRRKLAVVVLFVLIGLLIAGLLLLVLPNLVAQGTRFVEIAPDMLTRAQQAADEYLPRIASRLPGNLEFSDYSAILPSLDGASKIAMAYVGIVAGLAFVPLYLFFALLSGNGLRAKGRELLSIFHRPTQERVMYFIDVFVGYLTAFFQGQLLIALIMGILLALGFSLIGLEIAIALGLLLGLLNLVPYLGTIVGLLTALPIAYVQPDGGVTLVALALGVFVFVQTLEGWVLTPRIMANRSGLHPALVVISIFFWGTALGGVVGMILAVPLTAFLVAIWHQIKRTLKHGLSDERDSEQRSSTSGGAERGVTGRREHGT